MNAIRQDRFDGLDVLRGLAAATVVLSHYSSYCASHFVDAPFQLPLLAGYYAVLLFFMISGFVIYFTVERCESWRDFAVSRMTRLYPAYWAGLTLVVVVEVLVFGETMWWRGYAANMTMFQEYIGFANHDNVYWSLTVELAFYFCIAILFRLGLLRRINAVAIAWLAVAWCWWAIEKSLEIPLPALINRCLIPQAAPFFILGIMLYLIRVRGTSVARVAIIAIAFTTIWRIHGALHLAISLGLFVCAVFALSDYARFMVMPATLWLGAISYPLYLIHRNLGYLSLGAMHREGWPTWLALLCTAIGALVFATLLTYFVERPLCRVLRVAYVKWKGAATTQH